MTDEWVQCLVNFGYLHHVHDTIGIYIVFGLQGCPTWGGGGVTWRQCPPGLQGQTVWSDQAYASWHMPHAGPCSQFCADWCHDFPILSYLTPLLDPSTSIRLGPRPRGEGSLAFPVVCELSDRLTD